MIACKSREELLEEKRRFWIQHMKTGRLNLPQKKGFGIFEL